MTQIDERYQLAQRITREAGEMTLKYFQTDQFSVERKEDGSPLTIADRESEQFLRAEIQQAFPDDAIIGEEFGESGGSSGFKWLLDPIDGTKSFISGVPLYGTIVGVLKEDDQGIQQNVIGSIYLPGLDEGVHASAGNGAWHFRGQHEPVAARVSKSEKLADSVFVTSEVECFFKRGAADAYRSLAEKVYFARSWGDAYGYFLVAIGRVAVMVDASLSLWETVACKTIIEEAGGKFTNWNGDPCFDSQEGVGSNGLIHADVIDILRGN